MYKHSCLDVYLFVGPNGYWRVGPDTSTFKGTHFKHPQKPTPDTPPRSGWQYWNEEWLDDDTIRVGRAGSGEINQFGLNCELAFDEALIGEFAIGKTKDILCFLFQVLRLTLLELLLLTKVTNLESMN